MNVASHWEIRHLADKRLGSSAPAWDLLLHRLWGGHPMLHSSFVDALLAHFGTGHEVLAIGKDSENAVVGACVLSSGRFGRWQTFLPAQLQIGATLIGHPVGIDLLLRSLPGMAMQLDFLCNDPQYGDLGTNGTDSLDHAHTTSIRLDGGFDAYWTSRPNKLRQNLRRYARRLADHGEVRLVEIDDASAMDQAVKRYATIEAAGWKGREGTALAPGSNQKRFYSRVMHEFAQRGEARVYELWAGKHHVASRLAVMHGDVVVMLKTTFDEHRSECSPGHLLLERTLDRLFTTHTGKSVEFYTNATPDQVTWSTGTRTIHHVTWFRHPWLQRAKHLLKQRPVAQQRSQDSGHGT